MLISIVHSYLPGFVICLYFLVTEVCTVFIHVLDVILRTWCIILSLVNTVHFISSWILVHKFFFVNEVKPVMMLALCTVPKWCMWKCFTFWVCLSVLTSPNVKSHFDVLWMTFLLWLQLIARLFFFGKIITKYRPYIAAKTVSDKHCYWCSFMWCGNLMYQLLMEFFVIRVKFSCAKTFCMCHLDCKMNLIKFQLAMVMKVAVE